MKPFIVITGMHRSGTSFLARALNLAGVYLGSLESLASHEWKANKNNPKGHWESKKFNELGQETLKYFRENPNLREKKKISKEIGEQIQKSIDDLMNHASLAAGFKDPFVLLYLDSWWDFLPESSIVVGIFRDPLKVAESIKTRKKERSYEDALKFWKTHNEKLLNHLEKHQGFLLNFDWPKERLFSEINLIAEKLGLVKPDLSDWYSEDLIRSDKSYNKNFTLPEDLHRIYEKLLKVSEKNKTIKFDKAIWSTNELYEIIQSLLAEIKVQSAYFKKYGIQPN